MYHLQSGMFENFCYVYDRLGVTSPLVLETSLFSKNTCNEKLDLDDIIPKIVC